MIEPDSELELMDLGFASDATEGGFGALIEEDGHRRDFD